MYMLDAIKYWQQQNKSITNSPQQTMVDEQVQLDSVKNTLTATPTTNGNKKMASGGTFGEEDQDKLRELELQEEDKESILPPPTLPTNYPIC
jgi:hypothetical protein